MPLSCVWVEIFTSVDKRYIWVYLSVSLLVLLNCVYILNAIINFNELVSDEDDDEFICGKCKETFNSLSSFCTHKKICLRRRQRIESSVSCSYQNKYCYYYAKITWTWCESALWNVQMLHVIHESLRKLFEKIYVKVQRCNSDLRCLDR
jgi:hypothetical protein